MTLSKRLSALLLAIALLFSLAACQKTEPNPSVPALPTCQGHTSDPYTSVSKEAFYSDYTPACCYQDAIYRSRHGLLSGSLDVPGQYAQEAAYQPKQGDKFIHNAGTWYEDGGNTYVIVDGCGKEVLRIYKGGGYITLEEVAAYMYAFGGADGSLPANYTSKKSGNPGTSFW